MTPPDAAPAAPDDSPRDQARLDRHAHDVAEEWWGLYRSDVRGRLGTMTRDHGLADDLTVETFVRLLRHLRAGRDVPANPRAWLRVTARRLLIDHMRLSAVRAEEPRADLPVTLYVSDFDAVERREDAQVRLGVLTARQRKVMELRDFHDLSTSDVARLLGLTEQAVRSLRHKATARLRDHDISLREDQGHVEEATA